MSAAAPALDAQFLRDTEEAGIGAFLASRAATTHLVLPDALVSALPPDPAGTFTHSETLDGVPATARVVIVGSADGEAALLAAARTRLPGRRVLGLHHHVVPMRVGDRQPLKDVPADFRLGGAHVYAVACPARSGSTLLCALLQAAGLGKPREHLRGPLARVLRTPGVDAAEAWRQVAGRQTVRGVFGTKLVAEFLDAACTPCRTPADVLAPLAEAGARVVALHRPVLDTTVSRYLSGHTRTFHARGGTLDAADRARFEAVAYDYDALVALLRENLAENARLAAAVASLPADRVLAVDYAALDAAPVRTLRAVAAFLGLEPAPDKVTRHLLPTKLSDQVANSGAIKARFIDELAQREPALAAAMAGDPQQAGGQAEA